MANGCAAEASTHRPFPHLRADDENREHLYRVHSTPIQCVRCWLIVKTEVDLKEHVRTQAPCLIQPQLVEWVSREKVRILKDRKKVLSGKTEEERWNGVYGILFPDDLFLPSSC